jgi:hypothetical protein
MLLAILIVVIIIAGHSGKQERKAKTAPTTELSTLPGQIKALTGLQSVTLTSVVMDDTAYRLLQAAYAADTGKVDAPSTKDLWVWYDGIAGDQSGDRLGAEYRIAPRLRKDVVDDATLVVALQNVIDLCTALRDADVETQAAAVRRLARTCRSDAARNRKPDA